MRISYSFLKGAHEINTVYYRSSRCDLFRFGEICIPVEKSVNDDVYAGTTVVKGEAVIKIVATGIKTRFGKTVELIQIAKPRLLIEEITNSITKWLLLADSFFIVLVVAKLILSGLNILELLLFTLTLLLASIPIALPAMTTITLALGSVELAKSGIIVRRLEAIEAASLCSIYSSSQGF